MILVLVAAFLILLFAGIPIAYILGLVALLGISQLNSFSLITENVYRPEQLYTACSSAVRSGGKHYEPCKDQ